MGKIKDKILAKLLGKEFVNAERILIDSEKALHARMMLDNPVFNDAVKEMEGELLSMWKDSHFDDKKGREEIFVAYQAIQKLKFKLEAFANNVRITELVKEQEQIYRNMVV